MRFNCCLVWLIMEMVHFVYVLIVCDLFWFLFLLFSKLMPIERFGIEYTKTEEAEDEERKKQGKSLS